MAKAPETKSRFSTATLALGFAAVLAVAAIVIAAVRGGSSDAPTNMTVPATNANPANPAEAIAALRQQVAQNPDDARGWFLLAITLRETGTFDQAEQAFRRAVELEPRNVRHISYLAESLLLQGTDAKRAEARQLLDRASAIDSNEPMVRFYRSTLKDLEGDHAGAVNDLIALLRDAPAGASWEPQVRQTVRQIAQANRIDIANRMPPERPATQSGAAIPGPTREQMAQASSIPPGQQDQMVRQMVDGLAARLQRNPRDAEGWIRLMRSRMVLNERDNAAAALRSALAAFQDDSATQQRLRTAAAELGVPQG